jgi:regulator of sirC expression with transglutaminase-like and TPR domain
MRYLLLLLIVVSTCPAGDSAWSTIPAPARALVDRILALNAALEPELDQEAARTAFADLVTPLRGTVRADAPAAAIQALNQAILSGRQVTYLSRQYWRDSSLAAALLRRQGNCLATTTLYVAVARALDLPIAAVLVPGHAFVCWAGLDGRRLNIETTDNGSSRTDLSYLARFDIDRADLAFYQWMQPLNDEALLAELEVVAARHLAGRQQHPDARAHLARAIATLPHRTDLMLLDQDFAANHTRDRAPLHDLATRVAADPKAPRPAVLAALRTLAAEHRARLDRAAERSALMRAYGLAPWHEQDEILESLSTCLRGLRDHTGAALCMELAVARDPDNIGKRAWLAGMLVEAGRLDEGLALIAAVRAENPEESYFATMQAGLLVTAGRRDEGRRIFDAITPPRTGLETYETNRAWFFAVWGDRQEFYPQFERVLGSATDPSILSWIAEDDDLDPYRTEARFQAAVAACQARLLGAAEPTAPGRN